MLLIIFLSIVNLGTESKVIEPQHQRSDKYFKSLEVIYHDNNFFKKQVFYDKVPLRETKNKKNLINISKL